jgi:hypothetical protein
MKTEDLHLISEGRIGTRVNEEERASMMTISIGIMQGSVSILSEGGEMSGDGREVVIFT